MRRPNIHIFLDETGDLMDPYSKTPYGIGFFAVKEGAPLDKLETAIKNAGLDRLHFKNLRQRKILKANLLVSQLTKRPISYGAVIETNSNYTLEVEKKEKKKMVGRYSKEELAKVNVSAINRLMHMYTAALRVPVIEIFKKFSYTRPRIVINAGTIKDPKTHEEKLNFLGSHLYESLKWSEMNLKKKAGIKIDANAIKIKLIDGTNASPLFVIADFLAYSGGALARNEQIGIDLSKLMLDKFTENNNKALFGFDRFQILHTRI